MRLFYIRHGHPTYNPDALTPLGWKEAEAVAKRLALFGVDKIYASSSNRAQETAKPTCNLLAKEMTVLDFANEGYVWRDFSIPLNENKRTWVFAHPKFRKTLIDPSVLALGHDWASHPEFADFQFQQGIDRVRTESDKFLASLGYEHIAGQGVYKAVKPNNDKIAIFAHHGFGIAFLSCLFDIPYPLFSMHFDISHTGMTVIEFPEEDGLSIPYICTFSSDAHLYKEGLPTNYNDRFRF